MCTICNIRLPQAMGDISSIGIGIGTAVADNIGYRAPARYRSNPSVSVCYHTAIQSTSVLRDTWLCY